ncbi:stress-responsive transcription factor hsf1 [Podila epigama]|nr:stress-responsive transcription factor hsf1 [Podila epigama]
MAPASPSVSVSAVANANVTADTVVSPATKAAMTLVNTSIAGSPSTLQTSDAAMALLQAASNNAAVDIGQIQRPTLAGPSVSNMLVNGTNSKASSPAGRTPAPRPSSTARGNVAAFLTKLYKHVEFAKEVLPKFFKHNNFSSFVRQLNMYGFHKVPHLQQGVLAPDTDSEQWEFSNPHFQKNQPDLLCLVSRKKASNGNEDKDALTMDLGHILSEVTAIKKHQIAISSDLKNIERDHQALWQESIAARERHQRQQDTIDKILRFLASVFSGEQKRAIVPNKKPRLTITEGDLVDELELHSDNQGPVAEYEEDLATTLGNKRKRASKVESDSDLALPGMDSNTGSATLALLATANQSLRSESNSPTTNPVLTTTLPTSTASSTPSITQAISPATSSAAPALFPEYLASLSNVNYADQSFASNLNIPTTLLPNAISTAHHDMLRSISMSNARESSPTSLPPTFSQTTAGGSVMKGVDQIAEEMEQLQKSIEALKEHGLNVNDFNFDDPYLNMPPGYGYDALDGLNDSSTLASDPLASSISMDHLINTDQDDLSFISPTLSHQHISSEQATPSSISTTSSSSSNSAAPATSISAAITPLPLSDAPKTGISSLQTPSSSIPSPASLSPNSTAPSTPKSNRRMSTVEDE